MKAIADLHTHSTFSDGRGSVLENISAAAQRGLERYAITDHGPHNIGVGVGHEEVYLKVRAEVDKYQGQFPTTEVLVGAEADVISLEGDIDLSCKLIEQLDLLIIGLHPYVWPKTWPDGRDFIIYNQAQRFTRSNLEKLRNRNTKALIGALDKYAPDIASHPNLGMPVDISEVAQACVRNDCAFEINTGHDYQTVEEVELAAQEGVKFVVNSDAHFPDRIGCLESGILLLAQAGINPEQTLNLVNATAD